VHLGARIGRWFHQLFNPHCPHCEEIHERELVCSSCEILKQQLDIANAQNMRLLDRVTAIPEKEVVQPPVPVTRPRHLPFHVRQQILEREDRERARAMREAPKPDSQLVKNGEIDVSELEREIGIAEAEREAQSSS